MKKILTNIWYKFGSTIIHTRENNLSSRDKRNARKELEPGDVILVGALRRMHSLYIGGIFTHALMYVGAGMCIHAIAHGVGTVSLHDVLSEYDTMAILRHKKRNKEKIKKAIQYAEQQIGKPFDFTFENDADKLYCTELLQHAFTKGHMGMKKIAKKDMLHPMDLLKGSFKTIFTSHNIKESEKGLVYHSSNHPQGLHWFMIHAAKKGVMMLKKIMNLNHYKN